MMSSRHALLAAGVVLSLGLAACGGGSNLAATGSAKGAIKIWYSNNADEVKWGNAVVAAWNQSHSSEQVTAEQIPAGKSSEEVIGAAITAGTTRVATYPASSSGAGRSPIAARLAGSCTSSSAA